MGDHEQTRRCEAHAGATHDPQIQTPAQLAEENFDFALRVAGSFTRKLPWGTDTDAIRGAALEALVRAARSFEPGRGWKFRTWAYTRIWGAMLDELRRLDPNTRYSRSQGTARPLPLSLDAPIHADPDGTQASLGDLLPAPRGTVEQAEQNLELWELVDAIQALPEPTRTMLIRCLNEEPLRAIAADYGVSESRVSQRLMQARDELAHVA